MKLKIYHIILTGFILLLSCDENFVVVNCQDCLDQEPIEATITVQLDKRQSMETMINIYEGNIEDDILIKTIYSISEETGVNLKINRKYTFCAVYHSLRNNNTVKVVNSVYPRVRYETNQCTDPCYYVYDTNIKLKLKYKNF
jgi:hypothetical protein